MTATNRTGEKYHMVIVGFHGFGGEVHMRMWFHGGHQLKFEG